MASTSTLVQIASSVKATLDGYNITCFSKQPTICSIKALKMELCNMVAAVEGKMTGGKFGYMYLILKKPNDVNPKFKSKKKESLNSYRIRQLEAETRKESMATSPRKR